MSAERVSSGSEGGEFRERVLDRAIQHIREGLNGMERPEALASILLDIIDSVTKDPSKLDKLVKFAGDLGATVDDPTTRDRIIKLAEGIKD